MPIGGCAGVGGSCGRAGRPPPPAGDGGDTGVTGGDLGTRILCVRDATFPLMRSFFGGGEGLFSMLGDGGAMPGGFGARFGLPWLTRGRSDRSEAESEGAGADCGGADDNDVILPPSDPCPEECKALLFLCSVLATWLGSVCSDCCCRMLMRSDMEPVVRTGSDGLKGIGDFCTGGCGGGPLALISLACRLTFGLAGGGSRGGSRGDSLGESRLSRPASASDNAADRELTLPAAGG